jgi:hypothetical protein
MGSSGQNVYVVTCGTCGQTWQRASARTGEVSDCVFCGVRGWIRRGRWRPRGRSRRELRSGWNRQFADLLIAGARERSRSLVKTGRCGRCRSQPAGVDSLALEASHVLCLL